MSPEEAGRQLIAQGMPERLVNDIVDSWMVSHGRKHLKTDFASFIRQHKQNALIMTLIIAWFGMIASLVTLLKPWPTKIMVDSAFGKVPAPGPLAEYSQTPKLILITSILTLLIFVVSTALTIAKDYLLLRFSYRINTRFKEDTFRHILHIPSGRGLLGKGDYIYRQNTLTNSLADYVLGSISTIIQSATMIIAIIALMAFLNIQLALICVVLIPSLYILTKLFVPKVGVYAKRLVQNNSKLSSIVTESVDNAETVQAYEMANKQIVRVHNLWVENYKIASKGMIFGRAYKMSNSLFVIIATAVVMYFGGVQALNGKITLGELLIFMTYLSYLMAPVQNITNQLSSRAQKKLDVMRAHEVLTEQEGIEDTWNDRHFPISQGRVVFQSVSCSYKNYPVLKNINLVIEPRQKIGIIGASGSGKSTLIKLLSLFIEPTAGKISIDGIDIQTTSLKELRRQIAYVSQTPQLFDISILENIASGDSGRQITNEMLDRITKDTGVYDFTRKMPEGLNTLAGENGGRLSGGQKQRIALARGLAKQAPIVCLDEPTSALDSDSENHIKENLSYHLSGKTTILISHRKPLLTLMDKVYVLKDGTLHDVNQLGGLDKYLASINDADAQVTIEQAKREEALLEEKINQEQAQAKQQEKEEASKYAEQRLSTSITNELGDDVTVTISH